MVKVKIQDVKSNVIKEVEMSIASDFVGTGKFRLYKEKKVQPKPIENQPKKNDWFKKTTKLDDEEIKEEK